MSSLEQLSSQVAVLEERILGNDRRYQERFDAQSKALDAAFLSQQSAVQTALANAEKAVTQKNWLVGLVVVSGIAILEVVLKVWK